MGLLFMDGFDHYATAEIDRKWGSAYSATIETTEPRRTGGRHLRLTPAASPGNVVSYLLAVKETVVCGFALHMSSLANHSGFRLIRNATVQCTVKVESDGSVTVRRGDYSGTILGQSSSGVIAVNTWIYLEFKIYVHDSSGSYEVRVNESTVVSDSGADTKAGTDSGVDALNLRGSISGGGYLRLDDLYIADDDFQGDCRIDTLWPDGAGNYSQWTPTPSGTSNYANVDDANDQDDDSTYNSTDVLNEIDSYTFDNLTPISGANILAVALNLALRKDDAGQRKFTPLIRISSTDYTGTELDGYDNYKTRQEIFENPPSDPSSAWSDSDVNGAEYGVKLTT